MSETTEESFLSAKELENTRITKDDLTIIRLVKNRFPKPKKAKAKKSGSSGGKKSEEQIYLGRLVSGAVSSKTKLNEETDEKKKSDALTKRKADFRKNASKILESTKIEETDLTKLLKSGLAVLLDIRVPPTISKDSKQETPAETPNPSTN